MKITIVRAEDWEALYINGHLENENHSIMAERALEIVSKAFNNMPTNSNPRLEMEVIFADDKWLSDRGNMPTFLQDVRRA